MPWWPADRAETTLHRIALHLVAETHRHAGHADIVRELVDGSAGFRPGSLNLPELDDAARAAHWERLDRAARDAAG